MIPRPIDLERLAYHLGPKAIQHFDKAAQFMDYNGRPYPTSARLPIVRLGVFGSAFDAELPHIMDDKRIENVHEKRPAPALLYAAQQAGRELAKQGQVIVTGACRGLPYEVIKAAKAYRPSTFVIGVSPAPSEASHIEKEMPIELHDWMFYSGAIENKIGQALVELGIMPAYDPFSFSDRDNRNIDLINGAAFFSGGSGSAHELMGSWESGKINGLLFGFGGISGRISPILDEVIAYKNTGASYFEERNPRVMVQRLVAQTRVGMLSQGGYRVGTLWVYRNRGQEVYIHVKEFELNQTKKNVPDVTSPIRHRELRPEYALITRNSGSVDAMVRGFASGPINERSIDGELYGVDPRRLKHLRKSLHAVGTTSPDAIAIIEHVRSKERKVA